MPAYAGPPIAIREFRARPRTECPARAGTAPPCRRCRTRTGRPTSAGRRSCLRAPSRRAGSRSHPARAAWAPPRRRRSAPRPAARRAAAARGPGDRRSTTSAASRYRRPRTLISVGSPGPRRRCRRTGHISIADCGMVIAGLSTAACDWTVDCRLRLWIECHVDCGLTVDCDCDCGRRMRLKIADCRRQ